MMTGSRIKATPIAARRAHDAGFLEQETLADLFDSDVTEDFDSVLDADSDFDVEDDIAFLGEDYDVLDIDDVLEICNVSKKDSQQH